jgi:type II secretory pathway component PulK
MGNERGIALVITLLVVALLTITVVEFTYSVEVDQHMTRNALSSLQASLLARSGVNLGEAFLLRDDDPQVDAYTEDWGQPELLNSQLIVPERMRLRVQIVDESGKLNINLTRPRSVNQLRLPGRANLGTQPQLFQSWTTAAGQLLESRGAPAQISDAISEYWIKVFQSAFPEAILGQTPQPGATRTPVPGPSQLAAWDFPSLDDASVIPGLSPSIIRRSRSVLTALDSNRQPVVNANTAPREVLSAIIPDGSVVDNIISQRQEQGLKASDLAALLGQIDQSDPNSRNLRSMLGVRSAYFTIRASAIVNPNPITGRGGISRSASMLVRRDPRPGVPPNAPPGTPRWTLAQLDWQKEGGAALFQQRTDQEPGMDDLPNSEVPGTGG